MEQPNRPAEDPRPETPPELGRDELNLAEFPLTLLAQRVPDGTKTLFFQDQVRDQATGEAVSRKLTVTGSDLHGLPTSQDDDVLVGLIQLTKAENGFTSRVVPFSRYALIRLLGWPDSGQSYARLEESLRRWVGVTLHYERAWWDRVREAWVNAHFHVLDNVTLLSREGRGRAGSQGQLPLSSFTWNELMLKSFQAGNLKRLDLSLYFRLSLAPAKRVFRYLDKHFYRRKRLEFDLREFACEHVGLSRSYDTGKIKEKLEPSLRELEAFGFIEPLSRKERYVRVSRGSWRIVFAQGPGPRAERPAPATALSGELISRGVTPKTAYELVASYPASRVVAKVAVFDALSARRDRRLSKNPAGFLVQSIRDDYTSPRRARGHQAARAAAKPPAGGGKAKGPPEGEQTALVSRYWEGLSPAEQETLRAEALARAKPWMLRQYERNRGERPDLAGQVLQVIVNQHVASLLAVRQDQPKACD